MKHVSPLTRRPQRATTDTVSIWMDFAIAVLGAVESVFEGKESLDLTTKSETE